MKMDAFGTLVAGIAALNVCGLFVSTFAERRSSKAQTTSETDTTRTQAHTNSPAERLHFVRAWLRSPLTVAAIAPSSRALARLITSEISASTIPVIELGPGTGSFTRALLARGVEEKDLALVEFGKSFAYALSASFPKANTLCMDAAAINTVKLFDGRPAGAVVSGLPLLSMPKPQVEAILRAAFGKLTPTGAFYQFTYGPGCPVPRTVLDRVGLEAERIGGTFINIPPATVYRLRRVQLAA